TLSPRGIPFWDVHHLVSARNQLDVWIRCSGSTLRGRFELPRALRPTRSQVWRVGPSFATAAPRHRPRSEIPSPANSAGGPQWFDIEFERHHGLDQRIGLEDSRMDLPEPTDLAT